MSDALDEAMARGLVPADEAARLRCEAAAAGIDVSVLLARRGLDATMPAPPELRATPALPSSHLEKTTLDPASDRTFVPTKSRDSLGDSGRLRTGLFGRYQILGEIARGGVGVVHRAKQLDADRVVALKVLLAGDFASEIDEKRFLREAETASQLHHPNIVGVYDIGREHGRVYYTMELVDGRPLGVWGKGRPLEEKLKVFAKACRAAHVAHMKGVIHRDLKPGNILVTPEGEPKVLDFGLAKLSRPGADSLSTVTGQTLGTPYYMSPEQAAGRVHDIDLRTDVWALGVILFETVSGNLPFPGHELTEVLAKIDRDEPAYFAGPADLRLVVLKALEKERSRRYPSAEALAEDIDRFLAGEAVSARAPSVPYLVKRWVKRHPAPTMGLAVALAAAVVFAGWQATRPGQLKIETNPSSASVSVDGRRVANEAIVPAGRHRIEVQAPDCETVVAEVDVGRGETRSLAYHLERSCGTLQLDSDEPGTVVLIGGERHGLPFSDDRVPTGEYRLLFRARGFESRERVVQVSRGQTSRAWVSMVPTGFRSALVGNTFEAPVHVGDFDGDGAVDASSLSMQELFRIDGRAGGLARRTAISDCVGTAAWSSVDWDKDGCVDDVIVANRTDGVMLNVYSGKDEGENRSRVGTPGQKNLWRVRLGPTAAGEVEQAPAVEAGGRLWVPVPEGIRIFRVGSGEEDAPIGIEGGVRPRLVRVGDGAGVLLLAGYELSCFAPDGTRRWKSKNPEFASLVSRRSGPFQPGPGGLVYLYSQTSAAAVRVATGETAWMTTRHTDQGDCWIADTAPEIPSNIFSAGSDAVTALDAASGRQRFQPINSAGSIWAASVTSDRAIFVVHGVDISCSSAIDGALLWKTTLPAPPTVHAAAADGPRGPEYWYATAEGRLVVLAGGRVAREVPLEFTPGAVSLQDLDADGRKDAVTVGYGLQVVRSSRILWKRRGMNAMRPRPAAIETSGGIRTIVEIGRWEGGEIAARGFDARTGEILWSVANEYDVMHAPTLSDLDGDGVDDVLTQTGNTEKEFVALSGRDGHRIAGLKIAGTTYPPAVRLDAAGGGAPDLFICPYGDGVQRVNFGKAEPLWKAPLDRVIFGMPLVFPKGTAAPQGLAVAALASAAPAEGEVAAWNLDGTLAWRTHLDDITWGGPFALDINGDGVPEIAVPGRRNISILDQGGQPLATWAGLGGSSVPPEMVPGGFVIGTRSGVARLRNDGTVAWQYACATVSGSVGVLSPTGAVSPAVVGIDVSGRFFCLDLETGAERWRVEFGSRCEHGVTLCDADRDGVPEAFFGTDDFVLYALDLK